MIQKLCCINIDQKCKIISVSGSNKCRLLEMGLIKGVNVKVLYKMSNYGPLEILINGSRLVLRHDDAQLILVEVD